MERGDADGTDVGGEECGEWYTGGGGRESAVTAVECARVGGLPPIAE